MITYKHQDLGASELSWLSSKIILGWLFWWNGEFFCSWTLQSLIMHDYGMILVDIDVYDASIDCFFLHMLCDTLSRYLYRMTFLFHSSYASFDLSIAASFCADEMGHAVQRFRQDGLGWESSLESRRVTRHLTSGAHNNFKMISYTQLYEFIFSKILSRSCTVLLIRFLQQMVGVRVHNLKQKLKIPLDFGFRPH